MKKYLIFILVIASLAVAGVAVAADEEDKGAAAEKKGEGWKVEREAELEVMRSFEPVSAALEVAVLSCRGVKPPAPDAKKEEAVNVEGNNWAALAGALLRAADKGSSGSRDKGGDGRVFVHLDVRVKNVGATTHYIGPDAFTLATPEGYAAPYNLRTFDAGQPFAGVNLPPGDTTGGVIVFCLEPFDEYTLHYYNADTKVAGKKRVLLMKGD